ncbi:MAG: DUF695 domain-containing protein [Planctomycetes bacterium]|nr:DUF695 domain-containing protein [Planctomycetota bacterium]
MTWRTALLTIGGKSAHSMVDDRFASQLPTGQLQTLHWFGVYCTRDPGPAFWHPQEQDALDAVENDLIRLFGQFGHGWAVYVQRLDSRGVREYYVYSGTGASLGNVLPALQALHSGRRLEHETMQDPTWSQYKIWLQRLTAVG